MRWIGSIWTAMVRDMGGSAFISSWPGLTRPSIAMVQLGLIDSMDHRVKPGDDTHGVGPRHISISNAAGRWRGQRPGATKTASARKTLPAAQRLRVTQARAARENRSRLLT